jgi:hypothetical protein
LIFKKILYAENILGNLYGPKRVSKCPLHIKYYFDNDVTHNLFSNFLFFLLFFYTVLAIAHNVPAVYDVFAAHIRALRSKDQGCKNVGEVSRGKERSD